MMNCPQTTSTILGQLQLLTPAHAGFQHGIARPLSNTTPFRSPVQQRWRLCRCRHPPPLWPRLQPGTGCCSERWACLTLSSLARGGHGNWICNRLPRHAMQRQCRGQDSSNVHVGPVKRGQGSIVCHGKPAKHLKKWPWHSRLHPYCLRWPPLWSCYLQADSQGSI
jgi:hypothetical protein